METLKNYINGKWVDSASGKTSQNHNPADRDEIICRVQASIPEDVEKAIAAAEGAFSGWSSTPAPARAAMLKQVVRVMEDREQQLVRCITLENGKTIRESLAEFQAAVKEAEYQIGQGRRLGGRQVSSEQPDVLCYVTREPLGVVSLITPWNFPLNVACRKLFPALLAGNTCVLKPSDFTPMTAGLLFEIIEEVDLPPGVANYITGSGSVIGDVLVSHPAIRAISFTGSTEVGVEIARKTAGRQVRVQLEMGGKNPLVVLADADLEKAADATVLGAFSCSGQWCTSTSRAIVESPVYGDFVNLLVAKARQITVGNGFLETARMGPVAGPTQYKAILDYIAAGVKEGAKLCTGGHALTEGEHAKGYFIEPTVFAEVKTTMRIAQEEIFGPVLVVLKADDFEHAVSLANDTSYGLASSIYTRDLAKAHRFVHQSNVGLCHVNMPTSWKEPQLEFGGVKDSGRGLPEAGEAGIDAFTDQKAVYIRYHP